MTNEGEEPDPVPREMLPSGSGDSDAEDWEAFLRFVRALARADALRCYQEARAADDKA